MLEAVSAHDCCLTLDTDTWLGRKAHADAALLLCRHLAIRVGGSSDEFVCFRVRDLEQLFQLYLEGGASDVVHEVFLDLTASVLFCTFEHDDLLFV